MKNQHHNEKDQLEFDLTHYTRDFLINTPEGHIWKKIICDVEKYTELMQHRHFLDFVPESPLIQYERPDVIYFKEEADFVMGIECFVFDASRKSTSKGSMQIRKEIQTRAQLAEDYKNGNLVEGDGKKYSAVRRTVDVEFSAKNYYKSLIDTYTDHASKTFEYKKSLEELYPNKRVLLSFFIEDITALGNYVDDNGRTECLSPFKLPIFLDFLAATQNLDFVLIKTTDAYVPSIEIQSCDKDNLTRLLNNCYSANAKYISYQYNIEQHIY